MAKVPDGVRHGHSRGVECPRLGEVVRDGDCHGRDELVRYHAHGARLLRRARAGHTACRARRRPEELGRTLPRQADAGARGGAPDRTRRGERYPSQAGAAPAAAELRAGRPGPAALDQVVHRQDRRGEGSRALRGVERARLGAGLRHRDFCWRELERGHVRRAHVPSRV